MKVLALKMFAPFKIKNANHHGTNLHSFYFAFYVNQLDRNH